MALPGLNALTDILHETNRLLSSVLSELQQTNNKQLAETNRLLAEVVAELEQTSNVRLETMAAELRDLNQRLGGGTTTN